MKIIINSQFIELQQVLKLADIVSSGSEAKQLIQDGYVSVNGVTETRRSKKLAKGDKIKIKDADEVLEIG